MDSAGGSKDWGYGLHEGSYPPEDLITGMPWRLAIRRPWSAGMKFIPEWPLPAETGCSWSMIAKSFNHQIPKWTVFLDDEGLSQRNPNVVNCQGPVGEIINIKRFGIFDGFRVLLKPSPQRG